MKYGLILLFWIAHVTAHLCFKFGSSDVSRWWPSFVLGNLFGIAATLILMKAYTGMSANVALALCVGGGFLIVQIAIFLVSKSHLSSIQIAGILAIAVGMTLLAMTRSNVEQSPEVCGNIACDASSGSAKNTLRYGMLKSDRICSIGGRHETE